MTIKGNFFTSGGSQATSALDNVRSTLTVNPESGSVSFKSNLGRGSGSPVEIPGESFDEFVSLMQEVARDRQEVLERLRTASTSESETTDSESVTTTESE